MKLRADLAFGGQGAGVGHDGLNQVPGEERLAAEERQVNRSAGDDHSDGLHGGIEGHNAGWRLEAGGSRRR